MGIIICSVAIESVVHRIWIWICDEWLDRPRDEQPDFAFGKGDRGNG
jgi:hypothetical protein